ncbi:MAG TPA: wax ester/triacylglycerol synthase family O-acyltransferase, partial [Propionibacteriaceae bacterium]|nr:wax ester/triacylglycerol synthase family O-acyltransferase [Propionibacteriaceae bacterium]
VLPLPAGQLLTVGMTSYRGQLFVGLSGDRDGPDLEVLVAGLDAAVAELLGARVRPGRGQRR